MERSTFLSSKHVATDRNS